MTLHNKDTFIKKGESSIIIKDNKGNITFIIREPSCTIKISRNILILKQTSESKDISIAFSTPAEAIQAHDILRDELGFLKIFLKVGNNPPPTNTKLINSDGEGNNSLFYDYTVITTPDIINNSQIIIFPTILMTKSLSLYINGIYIPKKDNENNDIYITELELINNQTRFTWYGIIYNSLYPIEDGDIVSIEYEPYS